MDVQKVAHGGNCDTGGKKSGLMSLFLLVFGAICDREMVLKEGVPRDLVILGDMRRRKSYVCHKNGSRRICKGRKSDMSAGNFFRYHRLPKEIVIY